MKPHHWLQSPVDPSLELVWNAQKNLAKAVDPVEIFNQANLKGTPLDSNPTFKIREALFLIEKQNFAQAHKV